MRRKALEEGGGWRGGDANSLHIYQRRRVEEDICR